MTGVLIASVTPLITFALLLGFDYLFKSIFGKSFVREFHYLFLLSIIPNFLWLRYYLSKLKFSKTGSSVLLITIVYVLLYFFKYFQA